MLVDFNLPLTIAGRVLLALMFILSGVDKLMHLERNRAFMASGALPVWSALTILVGLVEMMAGLPIATGFQASRAALALTLFTFGASLLYHRCCSLPAKLHRGQHRPLGWSGLPSERSSHPSSPTHCRSGSRGST